MAAPISGAFNQEAVTAACEAFKQNQELVIHINRQRSLKDWPVVDEPLMISRQFRDQCIESVTAKVNELAAYFFQDLTGENWYVNQETVDQFSKMTRKEFPNLSFTRIIGIVDKEKNIELMPAFKAPNGFATVASDKLSISYDVSAWVAKSS